ncbi:MAG TPA: hypothetical protein VJY36_00740 [Candidatus Bathyarchaeia archaeon]|nr:hypothetical protein [Candidatus Bathyarchaeia archaeon]
MKNIQKDFNSQPNVANISTGTNQLFRICKESSELAIKGKQSVAKLRDSLIEMKKNNKNILMTNKLLNAVQELYLNDARVWDCRALENFFVIDHLDGVSGCHGLDVAATVFDLPKLWDSKKFDLLRKNYCKCTKCGYLCYIFYSLYNSPCRELSLVKEQWRNARFLVRRRA